MNLLGTTPEELTETIPGCTLPEARRLLAGLYTHLTPTPGRPVRKIIQQQADQLDYTRPQIIERVHDPHDHSTRYLLKSHDHIFEAVRIPLHKPDCFSICLSSQVGCAMKCAFCATGKLGLSRNLSAAEIIGTYLSIRAETPGRITGAVFMGQGEPFHNYDAVIRAAHLLCAPWGGRIASENITLSTVGLVPQIHRYAQEKQPFRLIVSLTSARTELRQQLLPIAGKWSLTELAQALSAYQEACKTRVTLAWVLLGGVNDNPEEVQAIQDIFGFLDLRINLIDLNAQDGPYRRATDAERETFRDALQLLHVPIVRRYSVGRESNSACGMLAAERQS